MNLDLMAFIAFIVTLILLWLIVLTPPKIKYIHTKEEVMSMDRNQLRRLIIDVLKLADWYSPAAVELLMLTAAQESHCGKYIEQINGPALGIFQMEPATVTDTYTNFLKYKPLLLSIVEQFTVMHPYSEQAANLNQRANLPYQIVMARVYYMRFSEKIPPYVDVWALARYWKKYWNTPLGKGTPEEALANYRRYAI